MNYEEALAWLNGERSMTNIIPQDPRESWLIRIALADAAMTEQAYWIAKAHGEGIHKSNPSHQGAAHLVRRTLDGVVQPPNTI